MPSTLMTSISWKPASPKLCEVVGGQFVAGFDIDLAGFGIDHVERGVAADQLVFGEARSFLTPSSCHLRSAAHGDLGARFGQHFAGLGVLPVRIGLGVAHPGRVQPAWSSCRPSGA